MQSVTQSFCVSRNLPSPTLQHSFCYLPQNCVVTRSPCHLYKVYFISFIPVTTMFPLWLYGAFLIPLAVLKHGSVLYREYTHFWTFLLHTSIYKPGKPTHMSSYVTPVLRHEPFPSVRAGETVGTNASPLFEGVWSFSMALIMVAPDCSTTLILSSVALISLMYRRLSWEPGVAGTKITVPIENGITSASRGLLTVTL